MQQVVDAIRDESIVDLIHDSIQVNRAKSTKLVRIHESGDFFSGAYLDAWIQVAQRNPDLKLAAAPSVRNTQAMVVISRNFYRARRAHVNSYGQLGATSTASYGAANRL
jgi:hypothetical protein